jgi:hypothetical protein
MSPLTEPTRLTLARTFTWNESVWNPGIIAPTLWLDAADATTVTTVSGAVSQWNDKSGNARHATQANASLRPVYSSSSIVFTADFLTLPVTAWPDGGTGYSIVAVLQVDGPGFGTIAGLINICSTPIDDPEIMIGYDTGCGIYYNGGYTMNHTTSVIPASTKTLLSLEFTAGIKSELFINGSSTLSGTRAGALSPTGEFSLGRYDRLNTHRNGALWKLVVFPSNTLNRQKIEGWMAHSEGLTASLPAGHPYKTVAPLP